MDEIEEIRLCTEAQNELENIKQKQALAKIEAALRLIPARGWLDSLRTEAIKSWDANVFYIRVMGRHGYRLFFFCTKGSGGRILHVTHLCKAAWIKKGSRYGATAEACDAVRRQYHRTGEC